MIRIIIRRFLELLITSILLSVIAVVLNITWLYTTKISVFLLSFLGALIWFILNVFMLRHCYFDLRNKWAYYISNFIAYALFGLCTVIVYLYFSSAVYGWIFAITKFFRYTNLNISTVISVALFHVLGGLMVLLSPIGMGWIFMLEDDE